ncbi:hypothetical protein [Pelotomaculum propionicicum]|uniref:hypothetical protein n=1 Tax=Pelotomaculum propionicicum TaxID=258475 RepID=UPI003B9FCF2B
MSEDKAINKGLQLKLEDKVLIRRENLIGKVVDFFKTKKGIKVVVQSDREDIYLFNIKEYGKEFVLVEIFEEVPEIKTA